MWGVTFLSAALVTVAPHSVGAAIRHAENLPIRAVAQRDLAGRVLRIALINFQLSAWPLLLGTRYTPRWLTRRVADDLVVISLTVNSAIVGVAIGAYGWRIGPYLPHLPVEWAGFTVGTASWLVQRQSETELSGTRRGLLCALIAFVLVCSALVETTLVPHR